MKNFDFQEKILQISDPIDSYFECITIYDIRDSRCILDVWKYLNRIIIKSFSYFVN